MPTYLSPGVYVEEVDGGSKPIEAVGTAVAAFVGFTSKHPTDDESDPQGAKPRFVSNWTQFENLYGGIAPGLMLPHAVYGWFNNGGGGAYISRVPHESPAPSASSASASSSSTEDAGGAAGRRSGRASGSDAPSGGASGPISVGADAFAGSESDRTGINGLVVAEEVTMLVVPDLVTAARNASGEVDLSMFQAVQTAMISHCEKMGDRVAVLDSPPAMGPMQVKDWRSDVARYDSKFATFYYPWIKVPNPAAKPDNDAPKTLTIPPSGHIAGVWARNDATRGVWKAPANEVVRGAVDVEMKITSQEQELLNPIGVNVIRPFGTRGNRIWGARTLSSDPSWRYVSIRRLFNFVEKSILNGTQWVVFEPNDVALWQRVRRTINSFLLGLWRQGALFGTTPEEAFYVKCDAETNPIESIDEGKLVVEVGVAPVKPAEFVIFRISQWQGGGGAAE
ncbi:MAG: phage tail sheath family protein [Dehalococcoidia bacterium]